MAVEMVAVVFTDLVGSTALLSKVGAERAEVLRREHFALLRQAFDAGGGREVKNLGDGLMVVFPSAADAVAAGVAAQRSVHRRNRRAPEPLEIRIGIAAGDADVDDGDYFGVPVVQAARLCGRAGGGEVLVSDLVRLLAGTRGGFTFEPAGALELKGLDEPVPSCRVRWQDTEGDRPALPTRLVAARSAQFVGRSLEIDRLRQMWADVASHGARRVVLVSGEPGIGKTTLTAAFAKDVHEVGALVVYGRCDEDLGVPYQPWVEALGSLVEALDDATLAGHVADRGGDIGRLVPALARRMGVEPALTADADGERYAMFGAIADLLERTSADGPVLVVLDDLHWADRQSLQLLRHVATCPQPLRLMVVGAFRDSDVASGHPMTELLAALHREQGSGRISLSGLSGDDVLALLQQMAGHDVDEAGVALRDAVLEETGGNPFFVGEVLRHLAESGAISRGIDGRWIAEVDVREVGLPISVREVVGRRVEALGSDSAHLLSLASVVGREFDVSLLATVAKLDEDEVIDRCDAAVAAAVLQTTNDPDRYAFAHALIEHTLYDALSPARRARTHRAVAEAIEASAGPSIAERAGELAHHWTATVQPADAPKAHRYARLAGDRAMEQLAPDDAVRWYQQALEIADSGAAQLEARARIELLIALGTAQRQSGHPDHRATLLEAARQADALEAVDLLVASVLAASRGWISDIGHLDEERIALLHRAIERQGPTDSAQRARLLGDLAAELAVAPGTAQEREALAGDAVAVARRTADPHTFVRVVDAAVAASGGPAALARRLAWLDEAEVVAAQHGIDLPAAIGNKQMLVAMEAGDVDALRRHRAAFVESLTRSPDAAVAWCVAYDAVMVAVLEGDLPEAERLSEAALTFGLDHGQPDAMTVYGAQLVNIRHHQGRLAELIGLIEQQLEAAPLLTVYEAVITAGRSLVDPVRASHELDEALARGFPSEVGATWTTAMTCWAEAAQRTGHRRAAEVLAARLQPHGHVIVTSTLTVAPSIAHFLGGLAHVLGHLDEGDRWYAEADAIHRTMGSPLLIAYSDAGWAAVLADRDRPGDRDRAVALAQRAYEVAASGGYGSIAADARRALERLRAVR